MPRIDKAIAALTRLRDAAQLKGDKPLVKAANEEIDKLLCEYMP